MKLVEITLTVESVNYDKEKILVRVRTGQQDYAYGKIMEPDHLRGLFDRVMDEAREELRKLIASREKVEDSKVGL